MINILIKICIESALVFLHRKYEHHDKEIFSTRTDFRPFTVKEQKQLLLVGACLECHSENSTIMQRSLEFGLDPLLVKLSMDCILPRE